MIRRFTHTVLLGFKDGKLNWIEHDDAFRTTHMVFMDGRRTVCTSITLDMCLEQVEKGSWSEIIHDQELIDMMVEYPEINQSCTSRKHLLVLRPVT